MNRAKNRRIYHKDANTLNFNIFPKIKKNIYITKCFRENKYNEPIKYVTKQIQCCSGNELDDKTKIPNRLFKNQLYNPPKIQRVYKDPKSQCKNNDYNTNNRKRIQNKNGKFREEYNYSSGNYLHKLKQRMKNEKLIKKNTTNNSRQTHFFVKNTNIKEKHQKTKINNCDISSCFETNWIKNNKKVRTGSNYTQKLAYTTSLIADIKKKYTPNVSYAMDYTNTYPKQNQYPCYNSRQSSIYSKSPIKGIPIVGTYVEYESKKGLILKVNYNMFTENTYNILFDDSTQENNIESKDIIILDIQNVKKLRKDFCYTKKDKCNPCKSCN